MSSPPLTPKLPQPFFSDPTSSADPKLAEHYSIFTFETMQHYHSSVSWRTINSKPTTVQSSPRRAWRLIHFFAFSQINHSSVKLTDDGDFFFWKFYPCAYILVMGHGVKAKSLEAGGQTEAVGKKLAAFRYLLFMARAFSFSGLSDSFRYINKKPETGFLWR